MIIQVIISSIVGLIVALVSWIPEVETLPFGIDDILTTAFGYFNYIAVYFPPLALMKSAFLFIVSFKIVMLTLRYLRIIR